MLNAPSTASLDHATIPKDQASAQKPHTTGLIQPQVDIADIKGGNSFAKYTTEK
jgi:hypothetical protein